MPFDEVNGMCAYFFAHKWRGRNIDLIRLQSIVCRSSSAQAAYLWAKNMECSPGNIRRLQKVILEHGSVEQKRTFAREVPGADRQHLECIADIQEIMEM